LNSCEDHQTYYGLATAAMQLLQACSAFPVPADMGWMKLFASSLPADDQLMITSSVDK